jgi:hypothetical protein
MDTPRTVGAGPLLRALCEELGLRDPIDQVVSWDPQRCKLSPGERIQALVLNVSSGASAPSVLPFGGVPVETGEMKSPVPAGPIGNRECLAGLRRPRPRGGPPHLPVW